MSIEIKKCAVLGAGVMGAQIAGHIANAGIPSLLFDINDEIEISFIDLFKRFETESYKEFVTNFNKYRFRNNNDSPKAKILLTEDIK